METLEVFQSFYDRTQANEIATVLIQNNIPCMVVEESPALSTYITGEMGTPPFQLKISNTNFSRAKNALLEYYEQYIGQVDADYYLHDFSATELLGILQKPDEWSAQDIVIARKLLYAQGISISNEDLLKFNTSRIQTLSKPEKLEHTNYLLGYFLAFVLPFIGIFHALAIRNSRKLLPEGTRVLTYNNNVRQHALYMIIISLIMLAIEIALASPFLRAFFNGFSL